MAQEKLICERSRTASSSGELPRAELSIKPRSTIYTPHQLQSSTLVQSCCLRKLAEVMSLQGRFSAAVHTDV